ncbi:hypothetical protein BDV35DRAFT_74101 [Aspergillus flavus]|uniref:Uncharacterized protein n=1 Tax=Aspergillus flavus TaxID=5059 RepID=A0A5N6GJE0_ASPFL|nr:hypothetical protein BDV35DRAFT_74101 [Aspergillus flavus]
MTLVFRGLDSGIDVGLSERQPRPSDFRCPARSEKDHSLGNSYVHPYGSGVRRNMECGRPSDQAAASGDKGPVTEYDLSLSVCPASPEC